MPLCPSRRYPVQTHVLGCRRKLHCQPWGQVPRWDPLCAKWSSGGRNPKPLFVGQLQGRCVDDPSASLSLCLSCPSRRLLGERKREMIHRASSMELPWVCWGVLLGTGWNLESAHITAQTGEPSWELPRGYTDIRSFSDGTESFVNLRVSQLAGLWYQGN